MLRRADRDAVAGNHPSRTARRWKRRRGKGRGAAVVDAVGAAAEEEAEAEAVDGRELVGLPPGVAAAAAAAAGAEARGLQRAAQRPPGRRIRHEALRGGEREGEGEGEGTWLWVCQPIVGSLTLILIRIRLSPLLLAAEKARL